MSDAELDREWKPSTRPQSTMAKNFSLALNDLFKIDNSVADLDAVVSEKKRVVSTQTSELEALEARIKATEERLKAKQAAGISLSRTPSGRSSPQQRTPLGDTFSAPPPHHPISPLATEFGSQNINREKRANQTYTTPPMPGQLPPTPGASEGEYGSEPEYVVVNRKKTSADGNQDGEISQTQKST
ncbi:hypothetical protein GLAREA_03597 [Glarea lozoyensis ATCC 20868]|uniref:Uncharacterized protein n=1 Tax=Glarea lozoyensis (strain ATCC 20868 / MF5171) TaxID=1116229 RepID=S3CYE0_GLAL2|nr:uncharacterized protein GLAREA_03597 [Glarea lozoyensis ATCC 20868]EPE30630.1 hypothetical protein GLAREA_03597 [Glarea lozoyensis ATCC 20868]